MTRLLMKNLKFQKFKRKGQEVILKNSSKIFRKKLNSFTQVTLWLRTINWKAPLSVGKVSNGFLFSKKFMMMRNISLLQRVLKKMNLLMKIQMNTCQKSSIGSKVSSSSFLMMTMKATSLLITMQTQPLQNLLIWWVTSNRMAMLISSLQGWT